MKALIHQALGMPTDGAGEARGQPEPARSGRRRLVGLLIANVYASMPQGATPTSCSAALCRASSSPARRTWPGGPDSATDHLLGLSPSKDDALGVGGGTSAQGFHQIHGYLPVSCLEVVGEATVAERSLQAGPTWVAPPRKERQRAPEVGPLILHLLLRRARLELAESCNLRRSVDGDLRIKLVLDGGGEGDHLQTLAKLVEGGVCGDVMRRSVGDVEAGLMVEKLLELP